MAGRAADPQQAFYRLVPRIREFEAERRKTWFSLAIVWAALVGPGVILGVWLWRLGGGWVHLLAPPLAGAALASWLTPSLVYPFKYDFKRRVIRPLMHELLEDVDYAPLGSVSQLDLQASLLFNRPIVSMEGEDLVIGRFDGVEVKFSEAAAFAESREEGLLRGRSKLHGLTPLFRGLFFVADFNKPARGQVIVYPDRLEGALGPLAALWQPRRDSGDLAHVRMEDPRFERYYSVYASDPEMAHYVLTPVLMEELSKFRRQVAAPVALSVVYGKLYLAIGTNKNMLEPPLFGALASARVFRGYLEQVGLFLSLVEKLGLNRRIWGDSAWP